MPTDSDRVESPPADDVGRIGVICRPDHEVFGPVGDRLRDRGFVVEYLEPETHLPPAVLDDLDLLVNKKIRWESLEALAYAYRNGIPAWNGYVPTTLFVNRLSQLLALQAVGFRVPEVRHDRPDDDYVAKDFLDVQNEPRLNGEGDFYQPLLDADGIDHKYYAVDDGGDVAVVVVDFESKLYGDRRHLGRGTVDPACAEKIRRLLSFTGARGVGVDVVSVDGTPYALDVNPATSFRRTGLEEGIVDSIAAALPGKSR